MERAIGRPSRFATIACVDFSQSNDFNDFRCAFFTIDHGLRRAAVDLAAFNERARTNNFSHST
jgi:hypothetical protein